MSVCATTSKGGQLLFRRWISSVKMAELAGGGVAPRQGEPSSADAPWLPDRVKVALVKAKDFAEFKRARLFKFLRLFSGKNDVLGGALREEAGKLGLQVETRAVDLAGDAKENLLADEPYMTFCREAEQDEWDAGHAGPPCGTFSAARWNFASPGPLPVRSKTEIYGLATNNGKLQKQADEGTLLATRSCNVVASIVRSQRRRAVTEIGTIENPPGSEGGPDGPMWLLPEVKAFIEELDANEVLFNTCAFQSGSRVKWFKPGKFVGRLEGVQSLNRMCTCPSGFKRQQLVGKELTEMAAEYPGDLCREVARLVVRACKRTLDLEWWRFQVANKKSEVTALQLKWWESKERQQQREQGAQRTPVKRSWEWTS